MKYEVECVNRTDDVWTLLQIDEDGNRLYVGYFGKLSVDPVYFAGYEVLNELNSLMVL